MPPRLFPYPLRVGTDICRISRIQRLLAVPRGSKNVLPLDRFLCKLLTWPERQYFWRRFKNRQAAHENIAAISSFLAGRWAAKEACRKACDHLHADARGFQHILILPAVRTDPHTSNLSSPPAGLILHEPLQDKSINGRERDTEHGQEANSIAFDVDELNGQYCEISISHDTEYATAVAVVPSIMDHVMIGANGRDGTSMRDRIQRLDVNLREPKLADFEMVPLHKPTSESKPIERNNMLADASESRRIQLETANQVKVKTRTKSLSDRIQEIQSKEREVARLKEHLINEMTPEEISSWTKLFSQASHERQQGD